MHTTYSTSNAVIEWLLVVKMLETEIHLFRNSAIPYSAEYSFPTKFHSLSPTGYIKDMMLILK